MDSALNTNITSAVFGVLSSLVASCVFLYVFLARLRPQIAISPFISIQDDGAGKRYVFKILNKTSRPIINVRFRVATVTPKSVPGGLVFRSVTLKLKRDEVFYLNKYDLGDKNAEYAQRFSSYEDIESCWDEKNGGYIILQVIATDSLSGLSSVFIHKYHTKSESLRVGSHRFGEHLDVQ